MPEQEVQHGRRREFGRAAETAEDCVFLARQDFDGFFEDCLAVRAHGLGRWQPYRPPYAVGRQRVTAGGQR